MSPPPNLQAELNRKHPFATPKQEVLVSLLRTGDQLENRLNRYFREHNVTLAQYNLLRILTIEGRALTCGEIGEQLIQIVPAITGLVDRLERQGYVTRDRCTNDRRVVYVEITETGLALAEQVGDSMLKFENESFESLTASELKKLIGLLEKVRASMAE